MLFQTSTLFAVLLAAAGLAEAGPIKGTLVGYRAMSKAEYESALSNKRIKFDRNWDRTGYGDQLGPGIYTGMTSTTTKNPSAYNCAIVATNAQAWDNAPKYNVPEKDGKEQLWNKPDNIEKYGKTLDKSWTNDNTVRFAVIEGQAGTYQALIGADVADNQVLSGDCCAPRDSACLTKLANEYGVANYGAWNIRGGNPA